MRDQYRNTTPEEFRPAVPTEREPLLDYRRADLAPGRSAMVCQHEIDRFTLGVSSGEAFICLHLDRAGLDALSDMLLRAVEDAP